MGHFVKRCVHGVVMEQCRCPSKDKPEIIVPCGPRCAGRAEDKKGEMPELERCPFCDSDDVEVDGHPPYVICNSCEACGPECHGTMATPEAMCRWNHVTLALRALRDAEADLECVQLWRGADEKLRRSLARRADARRN